MAKYTAGQIATAREHLTFLKPGDLIQTKVLHVTRSGMQREIGVYVARTTDDGQTYVEDLSWVVAVLTGNRVGDRDGVVVGGAGMDMGFHLVYSLSRMLYPEGVHCTGSDGYTPSGKRSARKRCNSNDHFNDRSLPYRQSIIHKDGGYALRQEWL